MAMTEFGVNDALAVKRWSESLAVEAEKRSYFKKFIGSVIERKTDLEKKAGDKITYGLRMKLVGRGVTGDATLKGNEEALTFYDDSLLIDQLRHATKSKGKMSEQRVPYSIRKEGRDALATWWAERMDELMFTYLSGSRGVSTLMNLPLDFTSFAGNSLTAPDSDHIRYAGGKAKATITSSDIMSLSEIDGMVEKAKTINPKIQPIMVEGEKKFVMVLHPYQVTDLRTNTSTGQWLDIQKAAGVRGGKNPIYTGALGEYNGVVLHEHENVVTFSDYGADGLQPAARTLMLGEQAGVIAWGNGAGGQGGNGGVGRYSWVEELEDYKNQLGIAVGAIFGIKKCVFNSKDFGVMVLDTYATSH